MITWLDSLIRNVAQMFPEGSFLWYDFNLRGMLAIVLVSLVCGAVGSLVVANRMAFFSDALAHCAFAGVALGLLLGFLSGTQSGEAFLWWVTITTVAFGVAIGLAIAFVRETTGQSSDTVIGVFFAGALGLGAIFLKVRSGQRFLPPENFLWGNLVTVHTVDLIVLFCLTMLTAGLLAWLYNDLTLASFNRSLALSRRVRVRLCNYLFIVLLAVIVNLCLKAVGALLINALLIVPAATAALLCRNMRQLFWGSVGLCLLAGAVGHALSFHLQIPDVGGGRPIHPGESGTIVLLSVSLFFLALIVSSLWRWRPERRRTESAALPAAGAASTPRDGAV
jgi:zinc transport system permease protein